MVLGLRSSLDRILTDISEVAQRDASTHAFRFAQRLREPALLDSVPRALRFELARGELVIDPDLRELMPRSAFDPTTEFDVLARERVRRAELAEDPKLALHELQTLAEDPATATRARAWLHAHMAWIAQRAGLGAERDAALTQVGDDSWDALASAVLLRVECQAAAEPAIAARSVALRAPPEAARNFLARLAEAGVAIDDLETEVKRARVRRELLARVATQVGSLRTTDTPVVRRVDDHLLLFAPGLQSGALLDRTALAAQWTPSGHDAPRLELGPSAHPDAVLIAEGLATLVPVELSTPDPLTGPRGVVLLGVAFALLCGVGSLFAFRAMRRERAALELRTEFLATVTHELKTPLAGVRLVAELLADEHVVDDDQRRMWLRRLEGEAARLGMLIENVLDLGRTERGEARHSPEPTDLGELIGDTLALFAALAERDGIALDVDLARDLTARVDRQALQQVVLNLCDNARKYGAPPLAVNLRRDGATAELQVRDHGPGVPPAERERIFARFRRGSAHEHGSVPGVGLGLHLARAIALRHGGSLVCEDPGRDDGACFTLRLPLLEATP